MSILLLLFFICSVNCGLLQNENDFTIMENGVNKEEMNKPKASNLRCLDCNEYKAHNIFSCMPSMLETRGSQSSIFYEEYEYGNSSLTSWDYVLDSWFNEHNHYKYHNSKSVNYELMVGASVLNFICGYSRCVHKTRWRSYKYFVCDYFIDPLYKGDYPYSIGDGCENLCENKTP